MHLQHRSILHPLGLVVVAAPDLKSAGDQSPVYFQHPSVTRTIAEALGIATPPPAAAATDFGDFF